MRHRKKLIVAALLLAGSFTAWCFWPHTNPEARRALAQLRDMVEIDATRVMPEAPKDEPGKDVKIKLDMVLATVNMTDATTGLFARLGEVGDHTVVGHVGSLEDAVAILNSAGVLGIKSMPSTVVLSGQLSAVEMGGEVPILGPSPASAVQYRSFGIIFSALARLGAAGRVFLEMNAELSHLEQPKKIATTQGAVSNPVVRGHSAKVRAEVLPGETLLIGGLSQKRPERVLIRVPGLSDIPSIGSWFCFSREREVEEELIILVSPRIPASEETTPKQLSPPLPTSRTR